MSFIVSRGKMLVQILLWGTGIAAIAYLLICLALLKWQNRLIFLPTAEILLAPAALSLDYEEVWLPVTRNSSEIGALHSWWMPASSPAIGTLLYVHGNGKNIGANVEQASLYQQLGFNVFLFDYRGYGRSPGTFPTEAQVYEDAAIALNYLCQQRGIPTSEIAVYGHSLGGAIAIDLAARYPDLAGLIVESSFTSMREIVAYTGQYNVFPIDLILHQKFDSIAKVPSLAMPILLIHGTGDRTIPYQMSQTLFEAIAAPKKLLLVADADHNNAATVGTQDYVQAVRDFIELAQLNPERAVTRNP